MAKKIDTNENIDELTPQQEQFCQLYVCGGVKYAGQLDKCYKEVFGEDYRDVSIEARKLVRNPVIMARVKELAADTANEVESIAVKMQVSETLRAVMEETSSSNYTDRFGNKASPAPLRAVSVNAAKALMEIYPIKHIHETRFKIEGADSGITFNVIVPESKTDDENTGE